MACSRGGQGREECALYVPVVFKLEQPPPRLRPSPVEESRRKQEIEKKRLLFYNRRHISDVR